MPVESRYVPATQLVQTERPSCGEYLPLAQARQSSSASLPVVGRCLPAGHCWHVVISVAPVAVEYVPVPQATQSDSSSLPVVARYLPVGQECSNVSAHKTTASI